LVGNPENLVNRRADLFARSAERSRAFGRALCAAALLAAAPPAASFAATSTAAAPQVTFGTPGSRTVTLQVCNGASCNSAQQVVQVLDPRPVILSATASPQATQAGQLIHLIGVGAGKPPLTYTWRVRSGSTVVATLLGVDAYWNTAGFAPGDYTATLEIANAAATVVLATPISLSLSTAPATRLYTLTPCRLYDSRDSAKLNSGVPWAISVGGTNCGVPLNASAVAVNVTVAEATGSGSLTIYPYGNPVPNTNVVDFGAGQNRASFAVLPLSIGTAALILLPDVAASGQVHVIVDVTGYFAPPAP
jgi:hypothetical protein